MTKKELIKAIQAKEILFSQNEINAFLNLLSDVITETLSSGDFVELQGVGRLIPKDRSGRTGRNPATGQTLEIPASKTVSFKLSKTLKEILN
jgi:nucleoid DNA-binding protein